MKNNIQIQFVPIGECEFNEGQIPGVPGNPRKRTEERQKRLEVSIDELPELTTARAALVYKHNGKYVVIGGNRRLEAQISLGRKEIPVIALPEGTSEKKLRRIALLDNEQTGENDWEMLLKDWDVSELKEWSIEIPKEFTREQKETEKLSEAQYKSMYYEPKDIPGIELSDCIDMRKYREKVAYIESLNLPKKTKDLLKVFCHRFIRIDFESVANYYFFNASEEEKKGIERLRLVLLDGGG